MDAFVSDFLYAFRVFFKRPGLTILAILALSLSLGMSITAFSLMNDMFLKPLPFKDPQQLYSVSLIKTDMEYKQMAIPMEHYDELGELDCFQSTMGYFPGTINISGKGLPERYGGGYVTSGFLGLLGIEPILGKKFSDNPYAGEKPGELMISHRAWQNQFRADPDIIGTPVRANGMDQRIVAVLPKGFHFVDDVDVWMPVDPNQPTGSKQLIDVIHTIVRIDPEYSMAQVQERLDATFETWTNVTLEEKQGSMLAASQFGKLDLTPANNYALIAALGALIFVLLVACANVANLLVGRALTRGREMAIRSAIGATRSRIIRQLLTESLLLTFFGSIGGLIFAAWSVDGIAASDIIYGMPYWMTFEMDWRVFAFTFVIMVSTAVISGLIPAWQSSKVDLNEMLKDTSHTSTSFRLGRLTRMLAIVQIAFSCSLLFGAGLITRNVYKMAHVDPGYRGEEYLTMRMGLFPADYPTEPDRDAFFSELTNKVRQLPNVGEVAVTSWIAQHGNSAETFLVGYYEDSNPQLEHASVESVSKSYFSAYELAPVAGTLFEETFAAEDAVPVVVNQAFADECLHGHDPVGYELGQFVVKNPNGDKETRFLSIVGVVPNIRVTEFTKPSKAEPIIYLPYTASESNFMTLVVRSGNLDMAELKTAIQNVILTLDQNLPVYFAMTMDQFVQEKIYPFRMMANFFLMVGLMALFLAAIGVYGMLAFNVSRRRREIGIRMALGATTISIVSQVLRQGLVQLALGLMIGTGLAFVVGRLTSNFLLGVNPTDPSVYIGVLLTLIGVATLSFFIPARRAASLSPLEALRYE